MSYCPKCGNKVEETMAFCPRCGASLKTMPPAAPVPPQPYGQRGEKSEKNEKQEKGQHQEKGEKSQEKGEHGFIGYLIGGAVLIIIGAFTLYSLTNPTLASDQTWALMLLLIGIVIIIAAVYLALTVRRHNPAPP
jgi:uncharacterized membrane protein YvbJ